MKWTYGRGLLYFAMIVVVGFVLSSANALAVETTGRILGTVTDTSGAVVPNTEVVATNIATSIAVRTQSGSDGGFALNSVAVGLYRVRATASGFQASVIQDVLVQLNTSTNQNIQLAIGKATETVTVTSSSGLAVVDNVSPTVSTNISTQLIESLPNINRNVLADALMAPGVYGSPGAPDNVAEGAYLGANGAAAQKSAFYLDGADNTGSWRGSANQFPNPDAIEEVQVVTSGGEAEMGKAPGLNVNVISKSGTNTVHGTAYYDLHSRIFDANSWNYNHNNQKRPGDVQKWYGGTLGAPIWQDHSFMFFSFQGWYNPAPQSIYGHHDMTAAMVAGDFSAIPASAGQDAGGSGFTGFQLYDPLTGKPFDGNKINPSTFNPVAKAMIADHLFDTGQVANFGDRQFEAFTTTTQNKEWTLKLDHRLTANQLVTFSMFRAWGSNTYNRFGWSNLPTWGYNNDSSEQKDYGLHHTWTATNNLILQSSFHHSYRPSPQGKSGQMVQKSMQDYAPAYGITVAGTTPAKVLPSIQIGNFWGDGITGYEGWLSTQQQWSTDFSENVSYYHGKHNIKSGFEYTRGSDAYSPTFDRAQMNFSGNFTSKPNTDPNTGTISSSNYPSGTIVNAYGFADFLLGTSSYVGADTPIIKGSQHITHLNFYGSDQWKITPTVTLSAGLRYEYHGPLIQEQNRLTGYLPGQQSRYANLPLGMVVTGDKGVTTGFFKMPNNNIAPRFGLAYDVHGKGTTVVRAAVGLYYQSLPLSIAERAAGGAAYGGGVGTGNVYDIHNPWLSSCKSETYCVPGKGVYAKSPLPVSLDPSAYSYSGQPSGPAAFAPVHLPRLLQLNLGVQHQLIPGITVEAGYVGNRTAHLQYLVDDNLALWTPSATSGNVNSRRPNQTYSSINTLKSDAHASYDSMQISANLNRFGFNGKISYTLQQNWAPFAQNDVGKDPATGGSAIGNPWNMSSNYADQDVRHVFKTFVVYSIPNAKLNVDRGTDVAHWVPWSVNQIARNWTLGTGYNANSGYPMSVSWGTDVLMDGASSDRPNKIGPVHINNHPKVASTEQYIDSKGFGPPPTPTAGATHVFGNLPVNAFWGPGYWGLDASLTRTFPIRERLNFKFKVDASNVLNHAPLNGPDTNLQDNTFGQIANKSDSHRVMMMEGRFSF